MPPLQSLRLLPAALALLTPLAIDANQSASGADLNFIGTGQFGGEEQVTSITQFSDVQPTDWAYQALSNLIERYGCVAGYPNGTYRGSRAMTRYEAAALLNACLDRITEVTDELKRLMKEFEKELAVLRGRVDGLEARVGELEATQFSTTTKLRGQATFALGANGYTGSDNYGFWSVPMARQMNSATTFNYDLRLILDTSFTGKDLLRTTLRSGNFQNSAFGNNYLPIDTLESAFQEPTRADEVAINRLFYSLPLGHDLQVTVGPRLRIDDPGMLGLWPSAYNKGEILNLFSYAGAPAAYNFNALGGGAGFSLGRLLGNSNLRVSSSYVVVNAAQGSPAPGGTLTPGPLSTAYADAGGIGTAASSSSWTSQLSKTGKAFYGHWGAAVAYAYTRNLAIPNGTPRAVEISGPDSSYPTNSTSNLGLSGYWSPTDSGWIPSVSVGWGYSIVERAPYQPVTRPRVQSWMVGLQWENIWGGGDGFGSAIGQAPFVTSSGVGSPKGFPVAQVANDSNLTWEAWYRWQVTDHIAITPAIYYAWQVGGEVGRLSPAGLGTNINNLGGLIKTTFKF